MASGRSSSKPSLEVCHRKKARRAILKYGNACALSSGGGSAQGKPDGSHRWRVEENVRKSCGCPFRGWSDGRVVIPKVDGAFFDRFRMLKSGSSLWGRRNFDHFLAPVTLPAGCLWIIWIFWHKSDPLIFVSGWHTWWWSQCEFSLRVEAPDGLNTVTLYPGQMHRESTKKNDQTSLGTIRIYNTVPPFIKKLWNGAAIATRQPPQHPALGIQTDHAGNVVVPRTKLHHLAGRLIPGIPASRHPGILRSPRRLVVEIPHDLVKPPGYTSVDPIHPAIGHMMRIWCLLHWVPWEISVLEDGLETSDISGFPNDQDGHDQSLRSRVTSRYSCYKAKSVAIWCYFTSGIILYYAWVIFIICICI